MAKQNITFLKIQKFIRKYPSILFFQHHNLSVSQWFRLRTQLKPLEDVTVLLLKNTLLHHVLAQDNVTLPSLFQGPCFALGFSNSSHFSDIVKITRQEPTIVLLGALFETQYLTHLDVSRFLEVDPRVHETFLTDLDQGQNVQKVLLHSLTQPGSELDQVTLNFLHCLEVFKLKQQHQSNCLYINIRSQSNRRFPYGYLVTTSLQLSSTFWDVCHSTLPGILVH